MACCCNKKDVQESPDCMASRSTVVTTPEGEEVEVSFNMGTGEVSYGKSSCGCDAEKNEEKS